MTSAVKEVKLCLLGESGVGKSSIIQRLVHDKFQSHIENTIGAAFCTKSVTLESGIVKYQIWDTAGQEKFRALAPMYYRGSAVAIIVFDITSKASFEAMAAWLDDLKKYADPDVILAIAGNKSDLEAQRQIHFKEALQYANLHNAIFVETSAKTSVNIATLFVEIGERLAAKAVNKSIPRLSTVPVSDDIVIPRSSNKQKTSCCSKPSFKS